MSPDEIIEKLRCLGIDITRRTLLNYEKWELIPLPQRGGGGPGGRWTDYPEEAFEQAYAAWSLLHGKYGPKDLKAIFSDKLPKINPEVVSVIRKVAILKDENYNPENKDSTFDETKEPWLYLGNKFESLEAFEIVKVLLVVWEAERQEAHNALRHLKTLK